MSDPHRAGMVVEDGAHCVSPSGRRLSFSQAPVNVCSWSASIVHSARAAGFDGPGASASARTVQSHRRPLIAISRSRAPLGAAMASGKTATPRPISTRSRSVRVKVQQTEDGSRVTVAGRSYATVWTATIAGRLLFAYGASDWFAPQIADFSRSLGITGSAAYTSAFVIMALAMVVTRVAVTAFRAVRATEGTQETRPAPKGRFACSPLTYQATTT